MTNATIITTVALLVLPEGTRITDATGREYVKDSSGSETANINWISWVSNGEHVHTDDVALPATVVRQVKKNRG